MNDTEVEVAHHRLLLGRTSHSIQLLEALEKAGLKAIHRPMNYPVPLPVHPRCKVVEANVAAGEEHHFAHQHERTWGIAGCHTAMG